MDALLAAGNPEALLAFLRENGDALDAAEDAAEDAEPDNWDDDEDWNDEPPEEDPPGPAG
jgi:hypothetical protein